eukprot:XP_017452393.1 PREDICTED: alkaline phosphatase, placental-like [Rattus norvegicus]
MQGAWVLLLLLLGLRLQLSFGVIPVEEENPAFWNQKAKEALDVAKKLKPIRTSAKNLIIFLGDGMGVPTVTATRILKGQLGGHLGPETPLAMDHFPFTALSKTYNVDRQVPDSAGTATAYLCGVKANYKTIGVSAAARFNQCNSTFGNEVFSVMHRAKKAGKSVGVVTTTSVQHASPAGTYAHTVNCDWYSDAHMATAALQEGCKDIAMQLISNMDIDVILGGGRKFMFPKGTPDPEYSGNRAQSGTRLDGQNLVQKWLAKHQGARYVWNRTELIQASQDSAVTHLMGLFEPNDMKYDIYRDPTQDPSLAEMTEVAVHLLSRNPKGFYLFVEGEWSCLAERLPLPFPFPPPLPLPAGLGASFNALDGRPFTSILYGNGPGYKLEKGTRPDVTDKESRDPKYRQQAAVPLSSETHSGEDVAIFARGPQAHLVHGVQEQNYIAHVMAFAGCLEPYTDCGLAPPAGRSSAVSPGYISTLLCLLAGTMLMLLVSAEP